jgi:hypothetical protein
MDCCILLTSLIVSGIFLVTGVKFTRAHALAWGTGFGKAGFIIWVCPDTKWLPLVMAFKDLDLLFVVFLPSCYEFSHLAGATGLSVGPWFTF